MTPHTSGTNRPRIAHIERILSARMPAMWDAYGLDLDASAIASDVRRALALIAGDRLASDETRHEARPLVEWVPLWAQRAVEERVAEDFRAGTPGAARAYCRRCLAESVAKYHQQYALQLPERTREEHIQTAEDEAIRQLAAANSTQPLHLWIRRVAPRENTSADGTPTKLIERQNIATLADWLDLQAHLSVERYVVAEMRQNPRSHLITLNLIWIAQHVCLWHRVRYGSPQDPRASLSEIWATLLDTVPPELHERIFDHTSEVCVRITKGLNTFAGQSTFDTWRTTVLNNTLSTIAKREKRIARNERSLYATPRYADSNGRDDDHLLPIADERLSLDAFGDWLDLRGLVAEVVHAFLSGREVERKICELRLSGVPAKEVAKQCGVPSTRVDRLFSEFKRRIRAEAKLRKRRAGGSPSE